MTIGRAVTLLAGSLVLLSIALAWLVHPWWIFLAVFVGFNLVQSSFTGFCPAANIFRGLGLRGEA
jgi:hypothetical protein